MISKHNERGPSENWRKELQGGFGMKPLPGGQFEANALYCTSACWRTT